MSTGPEPCAPRPRARRVVDWRLAAELLVQGMTMAEAAARVGCSYRALARRRRHDADFQSWMVRAPEPSADAQAERFEHLRPAIHKVIAREVGFGDVRVTLWLADRLKLVTPPSQQTPQQELRQLLAGLTTEELLEFQSLHDAP